MDPVTIQVDATPPGMTVSPSCEVGHLPGTLLPVKVDDEVVGKALVLGARVYAGRLLVDLEVDRGTSWMIPLLAEPEAVSILANRELLADGRGPVVSSMDEFEQLFGAAHTQTHRKLSDACDRAFTVGRYGTTYSIRKVTLGGFRTRRRVKALRVLVALVRDARGVLDSHRAMLDAELSMTDKMRVCAHAPRWRTPLDERTDVCSACRQAFPRRRV
jgi:hypothetical protein